MSKTTTRNGSKRRVIKDLPARVTQPSAEEQAKVKGGLGQLNANASAGTGPSSNAKLLESLGRGTGG